MNANSFSAGMLDFIRKSPTPYHATAQMKEELIKENFIQLDEKERWGKLSAGHYFITKEDSSLIAFSIPKNGIEKGLRMVGAHTDSPCLKVRPLADKDASGYWQLGVEIYGGVILSTWFDRDLGLAGKVFYLNEKGEGRSILVDFEGPVAYLPNLAIHLNREVNENRTIHKHKEMPPLLATSKKLRDLGINGIEGVLLQLLREKYQIKDIKKILSHDLRFYDCNAPAFVGFFDEFIAGARFDNLISCYVGMRAIIENKNQNVPMLVAFYDHEEVGSSSTAGASGPFLKSLLERIVGGAGELYRVMANSFFISADNAHGVHPNYSEVHDENHRPMINQGPVIKVNANQKYATTFETEAYFRLLCEKSAVPSQIITVRGDRPCGSTIGPLTAQELGVPTVDVGVPTFGMHSCRELAGTEDSFYLFKAISSLFKDVNYN